MCSSVWSHSADGHYAPSSRQHLHCKSNRHFPLISLKKYLFSRVFEIFCTHSLSCVSLVLPFLVLVVNVSLCLILFSGEAPFLWLAPPGVETEKCNWVELKHHVRIIFNHIFRICFWPIKTDIVWTPLPWTLSTVHKVQDSLIWICKLQINLMLFSVNIQTSCILFFVTDLWCDFFCIFAVIIV